MIRLKAATVVIPFLGLGVIQGCGPGPRRAALTAPFPLTYGGTPVPAGGIGASLALGDGLRGQELFRQEVSTFAIVAGVFDRVSGSIAVYDEGEEGPGGSLWQIKVRVASPLGPASSMSVHVASARAERSAGDVQDERLRTVDVALPLEFLLTHRGQPIRFSTFLGPRAVFEDYADRLDPNDSMRTTLLGLLGGLHLNGGPFHLFLEATLAYVSENEYRGQAFGGQPMVLPTGGIVIHFGRAYRWGDAK